MRRVFVSYSQPIRIARFDGKSVNRRLLVLDQARALDPCHKPEGSWLWGRECPQPVVLTYALFGSGAFLSDTFSVGLVGAVGPVEPVVLVVLAVLVIAVEPEGLVGVVALNLFTDGVGAFCTNCFSFAFFSSSAAFLKKAMRSLTEPMPPPNGSDGGLPPGRPNLGPWKRHSNATKRWQTNNIDRSSPLLGEITPRSKACLITWRVTPRSDV